LWSTKQGSLKTNGALFRMAGEKEIASALKYYDSLGMSNKQLLKKSIKKLVTPYNEERIIISEFFYLCALFIKCKVIKTILLGTEK
jgi:hypothetical protein